MSESEKPKQAKEVIVVSDGTSQGTRVMCGELNMCEEMSVKSVKVEFDPNNRPLCTLEIWDVKLRAKAELFAHVVQFADDEGGVGK